MRMHPFAVRRPSTPEAERHNYTDILDKRIATRMSAGFRIRDSTALFFGAGSDRLVLRFGAEATLASDPSSSAVPDDPDSEHPNRSRRSGSTPSTRNGGTERSDSLPSGCRRAAEMAKLGKVDRGLPAIQTCNTVKVFGAVRRILAGVFGRQTVIARSGAATWRDTSTPSRPHPWSRPAAGSWTDSPHY
jgi:hypothetical protein